MEWQYVLLIVFGSLLVLMTTGMPIVFCFFLLNIFGMFILFGGISGLDILVLSIYSFLATFILLPIPLFILMGEIMFHSGMGDNVIGTLDKCMGRLPGRLSLIAVASGTVLSTMCGVSIASTALLGSVLLPEMEKRKYKRAMTMGPIIGSGGLAILIPPSALAVFLGAIGGISIGKLLVAIVVPGLLMGALYVVYIVGRCYLDASLAPQYEVAAVAASEKAKALIKNVIPVGIIIFLVIGVILLGVATPSEAAGTGTLAVFFIAYFQRRLNWEVIKKATVGTIITTGMVFMIIAAAKAFSQILSFTGATQGMSQFAIDLQVPPIIILGGMQVVILILGCFVNVDAIILLTMPIFVPIVSQLGFDPVWFGTVSLINLELALITPPFGLCLFVMKGVAPKGTTMEEIYKAVLPFVAIQMLAMVIIMAYPQLALWLPGLMHN